MGEQISWNTGKKDFHYLKKRPLSNFPMKTSSDMEEIIGKCIKGRGQSEDEYIPIWIDRNGEFYLQAGSAQSTPIKRRIP